MGAAAGVAAAVRASSADDQAKAFSDLKPDDIQKLMVALKSQATASTYTLYYKEKGVHSMKVVLFMAEAKLLEHCTLIEETKMLEEQRTEIKTKNEELIAQLDRVGETWIPCLKSEDDCVINDDKIIEYLAAKHGVNLDNLIALPMYKHGILKDHMLFREETQRLAGTDGTLAVGEGWFEALDRDNSGDVSLEEMIQGLDLTRLMAQARRGVEVNHKFDRWAIANEQVDVLVKSKPEFTSGWRLRMILGTISDDYDKIIESADKIVNLQPGDAQALTLKAFYTKALGRDGFDEAIQSLTESRPDIAKAALRVIETVSKYWDGTLSEEVPSGISERMSIIALGSPADDDGTPRPRLLGTLKKTLEAAEAYPEADIFVTGGAVSSNMPEAVAMTRWLTARGVAEKRITKELKAMDTVGNYEYIAPMLRRRGVSKVMLITVYYHLNRSSGLADAVFEEHGLNVEVVGVAGESDLKGEVLAKRMTIEKPASYRDMARAASLYELDDFKS